MKSQWRHISDVVVDAYIDWVRGAAKWMLDADGKLCSVPVLVSLKPGETERAFLSALREILRQTHDKFNDELDQLNPFLGARSDQTSAQFTLMMPHKAFDLLRGESPVTPLIHRIAIAHGLPDHATRKGSLPETQHSGAKPEQREPESGTVVMGIIDEGIAFANERFRSGPSNSRVEHVWIQDGRCSDAGQVPYGRELERVDIDKFLLDCTSAGQVDEDLFYNRSGTIDFGQPSHKATARRIGHGTHVMDLACGYAQGSSPTSGGVDQRPIVCVKLPTVTVADTSGIGLEYYVLDGVDYILRRARDIAQQRKCRELPVVINFSSGILAGPRDGTHPIERAIDDRISRRGAPTDVVLPSGNSRLSRLHAKISLPPIDSKNGDARELQFRVLPDDRTCSYLEIWLPTLPDITTKDWVELTLEPPGGQESPPLVAGAGKRAIEWAPHDEVVLCKVYYEFIGPPTNRGRYVIALLPTALNDSAQQLAPFGTWTIRLKNRTDRMITDVEAAIQWDDRPLGYPQNGRQTRFIDRLYERFEEIPGREVETDNTSIIKRDGSINAIATGSCTIVAGGYLHKEKRVAKYSSGGPVYTNRDVEPVVRQGPDALARSDDSRVHQGILAAGTRSGSVVAMNGTSVAAPQVARQIAKKREMGDIRPGREIIRDLGQSVYATPGEGNQSDLSAKRVGSGLVVTPKIEREIERLDRLWMD